MSVRYTAMWYDVMQARQPVLPGGRNSGQKAQKGPQKKKNCGRILADFTKNRKGRKGAAENFLKSSLFLAVITTYNVHQDKIKFDF